MKKLTVHLFVTVLAGPEETRQRQVKQPKDYAGRQGRGRRRRRNLSTNSRHIKKKWETPPSIKKVWWLWTGIHFRSRIKTKKEPFLCVPALKGFYNCLD